ncbi:MAG: hypothetical protein ABR986_00665 [Methanomassiliicoccales archaeon]
MPEGSELSRHSEDPSFQLWMDFENVCDRYLSLVDLQLSMLMDDERDWMMERAYLERTTILASRRDQRTFHMLVEKVRAQPWYRADQERLSRYVALIALFPDVFDDEDKMPPGETAAVINKELNLLAADHPYLFGESWSKDDDGFQVSMDDYVEQMDADIWGDMDPYDLDIDNDAMLHVQEIDQMFLEEALTTLSIIRGTCTRFVGEGHPGLSQGAFDIINSKEHENSCMLARFVLECIFLRHLRSSDPREDKDLMETWQEGIELGRVEMGMTQDDLDRTVRLLIEVHGSDDEARGLLSQAAKAAAVLIGKKVLPIMVQATSIPHERRIWPALMHDHVMLQLELNIDPAENIQKMIEQGRINNPPMLACTTQFLKARCYEERGLKEKAANARLELIEVIKKHRNEADVLIQIPEAVHLFLANKERSAARKILEVGLKATASRPDLAGLRFLFEDTYHRL